MRAKLVIFDCDGVLVDTEAIANDLMARVFTDYGVPLSAQECRKRFQGMSIEDVCRDVARLANRPYDPSFPGNIRSEVEGILANGVEPIPGAVELVQSVARSNIPYCVASSGSVRKMRLTLGSVGLLPLLEDCLFSAQDIGRGKPHPDIFLTAAAAMKHRCEDAVIIEDSVNGVIAGVASGARVLGYTGDPFTDADALQGAGAEVFHHMREVPALIGLG
ncbi:MAG: HAD family phosphatase [Hyphomicrobiaceae bacterium]|nr:HAD family phosphatase [Hyphomicrobiaceae bacterium]